MNKQEFISTIASYAIEDMMRTSVLASITIAQACLESAYGQSAPDGNYFGVKGSGTTQTAQEFINGQWVTIEVGFVAYDSLSASVAGHSLFLIENQRYSKAGFFDRCVALDFQGAAKALQAAGYATDPEYADKLIAIITGNELYNFDKEAKDNLKIIEELQSKVAELEGQRDTILNTLEAHVQEINALKEKAGMPVPDWAREAVDASVAAGIIDSPDGGSYDFYRLLTVLHRKGLV